MPLPLVAIVGRPNVGKSSLFNRIIQEEVSLVQDQPGVTRDRLYRESEWNGVNFRIVDTGGFARQSEDPLAEGVAVQVDQAVRESRVVLFVLDAREGVTAGDETLAAHLRRLGRPCLLVANKVESTRIDLTDLYRLGLGEPYPVSAAHGLGTGDLLDVMVDYLVGGEEAEASGEPVRLALVGRPNVGKSTLMNRLLGEKRSLVSDIPGTTTDPVDARLMVSDRPVVLVDTAGLRRPNRVGETLEARTAKRTRMAIRRAHIVIQLIDATAGLTEQDRRIAGLVLDAGRGLVFAVNKWDLVDKETGTAEAFARSLREAMPDLSYAPIIFVSAASGQRTDRLVATALDVFKDFDTRVPTPKLNRTVREATALVPPPSEKGKRLKVYYATQAERRPPTFVLFVNDPELAPESYRRYLMNRMREAFGLTMGPLRVVFRTRERNAQRKA